MQRDGEGGGTRPSTFRVAPGVKRVRPVSRGPVLKGMEIFVRTGCDWKYGTLNSNTDFAGYLTGGVFGRSFGLGTIRPSGLWPAIPPEIPFVRSNRTTRPETLGSG